MKKRPPPNSSAVVPTDPEAIRLPLVVAEPVEMGVGVSVADGVAGIGVVVGVGVGEPTGMGLLVPKGSGVGVGGGGAWASCVPVVDALVDCVV